LVLLPLAAFTRLVYERLERLPSPSVPSMLRDDGLDFLSQTSVWAMAAVYACAIVLLSQIPAGAALLRPLRTMGRMTFTNYLSQAMLLVPICLAFGLFDTIGPLRGLWLALLIACVQVTFCTLWLRRFRMGPFERLWRRFTYGEAGSSRG